jgi:hypothetical protein
MENYDDVTKYTGTNPIFKAVGALMDIFNSYFTEREFFIFSLRSKFPDIVHIFENEIRINVNDPVKYTINNRFCDYLKTDYEGTNGQICIIGVPYELLTIQRAWRKWFMRHIKNRNDNLKQELMQNVYHPSKIDFTI